MRGIVKYFIDTPIAGNILMIFLLIMGLFSMSQITSTFFPEQESRLITIQAIYPGSSPQEMEEGVISKIEENLVGVTGVDRTTSTSSENSGTVLVEILRGYNADIVLQDVQNAVDRISSFPVGLEPLIIFKQENISNAVRFGVYGDVDLKILKQYAREIEDDLLALDGISKVELQGFPEEEIEIAFREADLRRYNMTFDEAALIIAGANLETTGGTIKSEDEELIIRARNKEYYAKDLEDIVLRTNAGGGVIKLHEVADVRDKWEDKPDRARVNGKPAVLVVVQNTIEEDLIGISRDVATYIEEYNQKNEVIELRVIQDGAKYLNQRIGFLKKTGLQGFFIVLALLAMFINHRLAFWVAMAIPISFAGMFIVGLQLDITYNVISLFGMIVVIGILVDDGIVIAENIYQKYEEGMTASEAALEGTMEVLPAVFSAIVTTVIAFSSFFFIDGSLGDIFPEMAIIVIFSLIFSLVEGAFILPAHVAHSKALQPGEMNGNILTRGLDSIMAFGRDKMYAPLLKWSMVYPFPTLAICVAAFFLFMGGFNGGFIKSTFFPVIPSDVLLVDLELEAGTREDETAAVMDRIEDAVFEVNEYFKEKYYNGETDVVEIVERIQGPTTYSGNFQLFMLDGENRDSVDNRKFLAKLRETVGPVYNAETLLFRSGGPFGNPVSISLLSKNNEELDLAIEDLKSQLRQIDDLRDITDTNQEGTKEVKIELKPKAYNLGYTMRDIIGYIRQGFFGREVQRLQRGEDEVRVWVRYDEEDRSGVEDLADMRIKTPGGLSVPLSELAKFTIERGVINISHIEGRREIRVNADVARDDVSVSDVNADIQNVILPEILKKYPSVSIGLEGQARQNAKTQKSLGPVMGLILLAMFFVIVLTFKSVSQTLIVFALIPFGLIGVGLGHYIMGLPMSLFSALGVIALVGIFVNDALVFISTFNTRIKRGEPFRKALFETGKSRFRPIVLTSVTTIAGLGPLLLEKSLQAKFLIPMAISVAFGLMVGTFILLVLIPALLMIVNRIKRYTMQMWEGETIAEEIVEPAHPSKVVSYPLYLIAAILSIIAFAAYVMMVMKVTEVFV